MKIIRLLFQNSGKLLIVGIIFSIFTGASSASLIALINYILHNIDHLPNGIAWLFGGLCLLLMACSAVSWILLAQLSQDIIHNLRLELTRSILACPLNKIEVLGAPKLLATLTKDINMIANSADVMANIVVNISLLIGCLIYLLWLSPLIFCLFMTLITLGVVGYQYIYSRGEASFKIVRMEQDILFEHFQTVTQGIKELKQHAQRRDTFVQEDLTTTVGNVRHYWMQGMINFSLAGSFGLGLFFAPLGILLLGLTKVMSITPEILTSYTLTFLYGIPPMQGILNNLPVITRTNIALETIENLGLSLVAQTVEADCSSETINLLPQWTSLELVNINHSYGEKLESHQFSLEQINLKFEPGEIILIVGGNGSGKSTLIKLITGLYTPENGTILFNQIPITDDNREWYRQQFSVVHYDFYLFNRLIGLEAERQVEIQYYLHLLELENKVTIKDGILSTTNLSQGQRKRLALLTAYLEDRPIYVFDEWASDQDPVFKKVFYQQLLPELKNRGKTVIAVSHDDRYFRECDRLIKLDYGRILDGVFT
ncbi:MAG: cyclic peptide export ABC transporter [Cyanobacteria bacterium J06621_8]